MSRFCDLHIHTHYSDGVSSPQEVVAEAKKAGIECIAITDHDTVEGVPPAQEAGRQAGIEVLVGVELSSEIQGKDIHILGYLMDMNNAPLSLRLKQIQESRQERIRIMIERLKEQGINNIEYQEVASLVQSGSVGRMHLAAVLIQKGWVGSIKEAFDRYLGDNSPAYVGKFKQSPQEGIALIRNAGGVAVLAHPMLNQKDELIASFVEAGLQGLEANYPNFPTVTIEYYEGIAKKYNLITTGGSDSHGKIRTSTFIGKKKIPYEVVERLKELSRGNTKK